VKRRLVLLAMTLVTAWSVWALAQPGRAAHPGHHAPETTAAPPAAHEAHPAPAAAHEAAHEAHPAEPAGEHEGPATINWTQFGGETPPYIAMLINFAILVVGYYALGKKPIAAALQSRRDSIAKDIEEAQRMKHEAEARAKVYQVKLEKLEDEMRTAREGLVRAAEAERDRIVSEAEAKADRMRKDAEFLIAQELKQIRQDLLRDTVEAAVAAAEGLLTSRVTSADQERLAEDYLADLGAKRGPVEGARPPRTEEAGEQS
jgi:F-type H+-transporting ATPase subunit b